MEALFKVKKVLTCVDGGHNIVYINDKFWFLIFCIRRSIKLTFFLGNDFVHCLLFYK